MDKGTICIRKGIQIFCVSLIPATKKEKKKSDATQSFHILKHKFQQHDWHYKSLYDRVLILTVFGH